MIKSAQFSEGRIYRYTLDRIWDPSKPLVQFVGLNPSTADEDNEDNTVWGCMKRAEAWGFGGMVMTNVFAFVSTDPKPLHKMSDRMQAIGPLNDYWLAQAYMRSAMTVCCWGNHGGLFYRHLEIPDLILASYCFKLTKQDQPHHPLYLKHDIKQDELIPFTKYGLRVRG